jgi:copper chaperone CopZ
MVETRTALVIMGMRDYRCRDRIVEALEAIAGVRNTDVNLHRALAVVVYRDPCSLEDLIGAVIRAGYNASLAGGWRERSQRR